MKREGQRGRRVRIRWEEDEKGTGCEGRGKRKLVWKKRKDYMRGRREGIGEKGGGKRRMD